MTCKSLYGNYRTRTYSEIFPEANVLVGEFKASPFKDALPEDKLELIAYLLYARYGNNCIASDDENQFKYKIYSTIFMYGPTWAKRLDIQDKLRALSEEDIITGNKAIYNHAMNPSSQPSTSSLEELNYIDSQSTTNYKKSKLEGYTVLLGLLETDVTEEFISKFKKFFLTIVQPEKPLWYTMEVQE